MNYGRISVFAFIGAAAIVAYATHNPRCLSRDEIQQEMFKSPRDENGRPLMPTLIMDNDPNACVIAVEFRPPERP